MQSSNFNVLNPVGFRVLQIAEVSNGQASMQGLAIQFVRWAALSKSPCWKAGMYKQIEVSGRSTADERGCMASAHRR